MTIARLAARPVTLLIVAGIALYSTGCGILGSSNVGEPTGLAAEVALKAQQVAQVVGGPDGFGGPALDDYYGHMAQHMGFHGSAYLADPEGELTFELTNDTTLPCTFHLAYLNSGVGLDEVFEDVVVAPGESVNVNLPCAEIIGVGSLTEVGAVAVELEDGTPFDNSFCVPGFLNSDYACGGGYACTLAPDVDDLDQDGDTEELIVFTTGLQTHLRAGGMMPHMGGGGPFGGMMGFWKGN